MAYHNYLGKKGEQQAVNYLTANGYRILERNIRIYGVEVDIIATDEKNLIFVEVKTRTNNLVPFDKLLSKAQRQRLVKAADFYVRSKQLDLDVRFDFIFVSHKNHKFVIEHYPDAFHPTW